MKTRLHKFIGMAVLGVTLQMQSLSAWAGLVSNTQVTILHGGNNGEVKVEVMGPLF